MIILNIQQAMAEGKWLEALDHNVTAVNIIVALLIVAVVLMINKRDNFAKKNFVLTGILILLAGYGVYMRGYWWEGTQCSVFALGLRPLLSAIEMFAGHNDLIEVDPSCKESAAYMTMFAIAHTAALAFTSVFTLQFFKYNLKNWWMYGKAQMLEHIDDGLYVFSGITERTLTLATDIRANHKNAVIIITDMYEGNNGEGASTQSAFVRMTSRRDLLEQAHAIGAIVRRGRSVFGRKRERANTDAATLMNVRRRTADESLNFTGVDKLMMKTDDTCFFIFGEDENQNISTVLRLQKSSCMKYKGSKRIFCLVNSAQGNALFEKDSVDDVEIKVVDASSLSVALLSNAVKRDTGKMVHEYEFHPVNFIDIDTENALATSQFNALVLGFGDTGTNALRWLYEFGQFQYADEEMASQFYVVDENINKIRGSFLAKYPGLTTENSGIKYINEDYNTEAFWTWLEGRIEKLNYVVIAVGDDERDITLAVDIYEFAERHRKNLEKFRIFVCSYNDENYERLYEIARRLGNITIFGSTTEIFKEHYIMEDFLLPLSQNFYYNYERQRIKGTASEAGTLEQFKKKTPEECWDERHRNRNKGDDSRKRKESNLKVERQESQDRVNALHIYTKMMISGGRDRAIERYAEVTGALKQKMTREEIFERFPYFLNLSRLEHLRWNAGHKTLGYVPLPDGEQIEGGKSCDEIHKWHKCMVPWEALSMDYKWYDSLVVLTSYYLIKKAANE